MSTPVQPTNPNAPVNAPVRVQGSSVAATNPAGSAIPAVAASHPGYVRDSPSGNLIAVGSGGAGYATIEYNGVPLAQESVLNLTGPGVTATAGVGKTIADFEIVTPEAVSLSHSPALLQIGASVVNPAFTASYTNAPTTAILTDTEGHTDDVSSTPTSFISPHTFTKSVYGQSVTFTDTVTSPQGPAAGSTSITWAQTVRWGTQVDPGVYNSAFIAGLSNSSLQLGPGGTFAVNASGGASVFYATRTAFGVTALDFTVNGLPFAISKVGSAVAYTNTNGVTENYDVWMSDNIDLGAFSFVES